MIVTPAFEVFAHAWKEKRHQTVWTSLVSDLETPVSAMLKLGQDRPYSFLLESIEGGAIRGRYSIIGRDPDLIWRTKNGVIEVNNHSLTQPDAFVAEQGKPLEHLRALMKSCRIDEPNQPQPMAAGLFGYLGYDMIGEIEKLPDNAPCAYDVPESIFIRPTLLAIFDQIENCFNLVTPVWHNAALSAEEAYHQAILRLEVALDDLKSALPQQQTFKALHKNMRAVEPESNMSEQAFTEMVTKSKEYIKAGDIFQVVLSQRFSQPFKLPPLPFTEQSVD